MAQEDEDVKKKIEDSAREAESIMKAKMDQALNGEVEPSPPEEVEETPQKADSTTSIEPQKTPEEEPATTIAPAEETPPKASTDDPDAKEEVKTEPEAEVKPETPKDEVIEEINSSKLRADAHPKTKKSFDKVKSIAEREHNRAVAAEKRSKELEDEKAKLKLLDEPTEKELQELRTFHKQWDIEHDSEFLQQFDQKIESHAKTAQEIFSTSPGVSQGTAKFIADNGGPLAFRSSNELMPRDMRDAQGNPIAQHEDGTPFTKGEFWSKSMEPFLPPDRIKRLNYFDNEVTRLEMQRQEKLDEAKSNVEKYEQDRKGKSEEQKKQWEEIVRVRAEEYIKTLGEVAQKKEYPANATKDQIAQVDKHNLRRDTAEKEFKANIANLNPQLITDAMLDHSHIPILKEDIQESKAELEKEKTLRIAAEKRLEDFKNKGKTSTMQSAPITKQEKPKSPYNQDSETLMAERMRQVGIV